MLQSRSMGKNLQQINKTVVFMKNIYPMGLSAPITGLYICTGPLFSNIFFSETAWPINAKGLRALSRVFGLL